MENVAWNTYFPRCLIKEAFHLPQWFHFFLLLEAVSSTYPDFKPYFICKRGVSLKSVKVLAIATRSKKMKPLWKVKSFEQETHCPQQIGRDTRTDGPKITVIHKTSRRTGGTAWHGTAQDSTAHDSTGEQGREGDAEADRQARRHTTQNSTTHHSMPQRKTFRAGCNSKIWLCCEQHWLQSNNDTNKKNSGHGTYTGRKDGQR